jgi:ribosomal protein L12E/L44/L45/RPP1/RPP2
MKKQFAKLSKAEREKVESEYHRLKPEDLDEAMTRAKRQSPVAISRSKRKSKATEKRRAA